MSTLGRGATPAVAIGLGIPLCSFANSLRPGSLHNCRDCPYQNLHVEPQRPAVDVFHVKVHPLIERDGTPTANLPKAGDAGADAEAATLPVFVEAGVVAHRQWAGTDQAHVAF